MIKTLINKNQKFKRVIHIADIHLPIFKRHDEFKSIFLKFFEELKKIDAASTFLVIAGDLYHTKISLAPETVELASDFLKGCADILPTIIIAGNHDANMLNRNRLDSITPVVSAINHSNLFYLKDSGLYSMGNVLINNYSIFDEPSAYIKGGEIPNTYKNEYEYKIALYHGPLDGTTTELGYTISNPAITKELFDGHDIALLGDIHLQQLLQEYDGFDKPAILYPGTICQQNFGEPLYGHGFVTWDLKTRTCNHTEIENEFGYITVEISDGELVSTVDKYPKRTRLRVKCKNSIPSEVKVIIQELKKYTDLVEVVYFRDESIENINKTIIFDNIKLETLNSIEFQNQLIDNYLRNKLQITDEVLIKNIKELNQTKYEIVKNSITCKNLKWTPIRLEWDNLFAYGEGNYINFQDMSGTYGIFAKNASGKSSIISTLLYCLFDKFDRSSKSLTVLNVQKSSFRCKLEFEIDGIRYFIERIGALQKNGSVKVEVNFWKIVNDVEVDLSGLERRNTNDIIRDYVGTYDDFILTSASFQTSKNNSSFIDMGHTDRKDLLVKFIGLDLYDKLLDSCGERYKEIQVLIKHHGNKDYAGELDNYKVEYSNNAELEKNIQINIDNTNKKIATVEDKIKLEMEKIIKLDNDVPTNIDKVTSAKFKLTEELKSLTEKEKEASENASLLKSQLDELEVELTNISNTNFSDSYKSLTQVNVKINNLRQTINIKKVDIKNKLDKVAKLNTHEYDPNCKYCTNNKFVKDALNAQEELAVDKIESEKLLNAYNELENERKSLMWSENSFNIYNTILLKKNKMNNVYNNENKTLTDTKSQVSSVKESILSADKQIELYNKNEQSIELNTSIRKKISELQSDVNLLKISVANYTKELSKVSANSLFYKKQSEAIYKSLEEVKSLEQEHKIYNTYISLISRDGLPYQIISAAIPAIEREVNSILTQIVDYTIQFETDGKNIVPYISYLHGRWPIELMSGFERFVSSIAIRVALTNISNLPKTNFLSIDEGFATLDSDNLQSMKTLFSILSQSFDFMLIISHLDVMKDSVDKQIEIANESDFSKINFDA